MILKQEKAADHRATGAFIYQNLLLHFSGSYFSNICKHVFFKAVSNKEHAFDEVHYF